MNRPALWHRLQREQPELVAVMVEVRRVYMDSIPKITIDGRRAYHHPTVTLELDGKVEWSPAVALRGKRDAM